MEDTARDSETEDVRWMLSRYESLRSEAAMLTRQLNDANFEIRRLEDALKSCGAHPNQKA